MDAYELDRLGALDGDELAVELARRIFEVANRPPGSGQHSQDSLMELAFWVWWTRGEPDQREFGDVFPPNSLLTPWMIYLMAHSPILGEDELEYELEDDEHGHETE